MEYEVLDNASLAHKVWSQCRASALARAPICVPTLTRLYLWHLHDWSQCYALQHEEGERHFSIACIYEIDCTLRDKTEPLDESDNARYIRENLPRQYNFLTRAFSEIESDTLPLHCKYDHKINFMKPLPAHFSPLYRQSEVKLRSSWIQVTGTLRQESQRQPRLLCRLPQTQFSYQERSITNPRIDKLLTQHPKAVFFTKLHILAAFNRIT
ncbi:hypothetical protein BJ878DRAFT_255157 [Calycina marina]|uniref:Uncharacterized protein n=1 Tax=Calycina marina TaxID=1763456 RepID=A0A9P7YVX9_9HELO|nr:hypothetical protein BJ878DRAFT_255157 [Calycina marina]